MHATTSTDGTEIGYETRGDGEPLLLVHGSTGTRRSWAPFRPHLAPAGELAILDRRGRGASGDAAAYGLQREVDDVLAVLEDADATRAFGHSFGGLCALEAGRERDLERLVLFEPAILVGAHREGADAADRMAARLEAGDPEGAMRVAFRETADVEDAESLPHWPECVDLAAVTRRELAAVEDYELPATLDGVEAETLLLTAEHGPQFLRDAVDAVHERLPNARVEEIPGVGHAGAAAPDRVATCATEFLRA